ADPPCLARRLERLRARRQQHGPRGALLLLGAGLDEEHAAPVCERVLVEIELVFRNAGPCGLLELLARLDAADRPRRPAERRHPRAPAPTPGASGRAARAPAPSPTAAPAAPPMTPPTA